MSAKAPRFPPPRTQTNPLEMLALGALGVVVIAAAELWLTGELSGRLFGGAWPRTPIGEMGYVLADYPG